MKKFHLIGARTRDLPACSIVPQPTTLPRAPITILKHFYFKFYLIIPHYQNDTDSLRTKMLGSQFSFFFLGMNCLVNAIYKTIWFSHTCVTSPNTSHTSYSRSYNNRTACKLSTNLPLGVGWIAFMLCTPEDMSSNLSPETRYPAQISAVFLGTS
jgi:hypothetical protein